MGNGVQDLQVGGGGKAAAALKKAQPPAPKPVAIINDSNPTLDHVSLAIGADGKPIQTATRAKGVPDLEVKYRAAIREFIRTGADLKPAEKALADSGVAAKELAKMLSEEASSQFVLHRDEFVRAGSQYDELSPKFQAKSDAQMLRLNDLKVRANNAFNSAVSADKLLGGLDPARGRDLEAMEAMLLIMGFPKDEINISSRPKKVEAK